ncbi:MAG: chemotaxis-specific protein-glutamate methyltransferase CheB [Kofleriaceae bacterium]
MLRVLVAEDSPTARRLLVSLLRADPEIEVVGEACDGAEAVELCKKLRPDLVTMDIDMPVMDGVEATRRIMVEAATAVVMVSSLEPADVKRSMNALDAGALAVLAKPGGPNTPRFDRERTELLATIEAMAKVKLVRRWPAVPPYRSATATSTGAPGHDVAVIGLVASTGGPNALRIVLTALPAEFAPPILVVQHIAAGFANGLAEWLAATTARNVKIASHGEPLANSTVYVAPDDRHLEAERHRIVVSDSAPVEGFRPSGTRLFSSLASVFGSSAIGVILTGMGQDGVSGLRDMRDAGSTVLAQDEDSCDIFGMPGAAVKAGVVRTTTPLTEISGRLVELVAKR